MSIQYISKNVLAAAQVILAAASVIQAGSPETCSNPQTSCQNTTAVANTCCFNAPGGQILQTQFWDSNPSTGPSNSWTVHGLWPDHCDGTFDSNCDSKRAYTNITQILQSYNATATLDYMNTYWKDYQGNDESFWEHEWAKHGTCISTFDTDCYTGYTPQEEVVDFFTETVNLFKTLNSYQYLSDAGIVPSASKNYSLTDVQAALKKPRGVDVTVQCQNGALDEIWYHFNVQGSIQTGKFIPANPDGAKGSCSDSLMYLPKSGSPTTTTSTTSTGTTTTTSTTSPTSTGGFTGKGTLPVTSGGSQSGCIISGGTWYTSGTCASFTATQGSSGFTLQSSKGPCAISSGVLSCASGLTATTFTATNGLLTYNGANTFYAAAPPSGSTQQKVNTASSASSGTALQIGWAGSS